MNSMQDPTLLHKIGSSIFSSFRSSTRSINLSIEKGNLAKVPYRSVYQVNHKVNSENLLENIPCHYSFIIPQYSAINPFVIRSNNQSSIPFKYQRSELGLHRELKESKDDELKYSKNKRNTQTFFRNLNADKNERTIKRSSTTIRMSYKPLRVPKKNDSVVSKAISYSKIKPSKTPVLRKHIKKSYNLSIMEASKSIVRVISESGEYIDTSILPQIYK